MESERRAGRFAEGEVAPGLPLNERRDLPSIHQTMRRPQLLALLVAQAVAMASSAEALPQAHVLRIDPRVTMDGGAVILTTVVEVVQLDSPSAALAPCRGASGNDALDCESAQMEKPGTLWSELGNPAPSDPNHGFPLQDARFLVSAFGVDLPARPEGPALRWGESQKRVAHVLVLAAVEENPLPRLAPASNTCRPA